MTIQRAPSPIRTMPLEEGFQVEEVPHLSGVVCLQLVRNGRHCCGASIRFLDLLVAHPRTKIPWSYLQKLVAARRQQLDGRASA